MRILITGGTGMVGSAFQKIKTGHDLILVGSEQYDLRNRYAVDHMFHENPVDAVIHLAAKVGGVKGNSDYVADFFYDNIIMNTNVLDAAKNYKIPKFVSLLSTCIYPDKVTYPLTEDQIHGGEPHKSNFGYAYAKRMLEVYSRAIRQQYGLKYVTAVPNNLYGENDNFDLNNSHVIPAIIRKVHESNIHGNIPKFWGLGRAVREFTYSGDIARALLWMVENYDNPKPLNIGNPGDISIMNLVLKIQDFLDGPTRSKWDDSMPEGQYKKPSCNKAFMDLNPDFKYTSLNTGLKNTIDWFLKEYPNVRGV
jgi:GDP-L-fucose synthase